MRNYKKFLPARYLVSVAVSARLLPPLFSLLIQIKENEPQSASPPPCGATRPRTPTTYGPEANPIKHTRKIGAAGSCQGPGPGGRI